MLESGMASLRRSKVLSPDGQTAKFLYTIIKQLDLKAIDWNEVASGLHITNGHAARMRYSRFKAQIEGLPTQSKPRAPRPKKDGSAATKGRGKPKPGYEPGKVDDLRGDDDDNDGDVKMEQGAGVGIKKEEGFKVKQEDSMRALHMETSAALDTIKVKLEPVLGTDNIVYLEEAAVKIKKEPAAEQANYTLSPTSGIATMNINPYAMPPLTPLVDTLGFLPSSQTPTNIFSQHQTTSMMPRLATVSLADLQLSPIPKPITQMPLPDFSYPLTSMEFDFDFNAPIMQPQLQPMWQPQFDMFRPASVKQEMMN